MKNTVKNSEFFEEFGVSSTIDSRQFIVEEHTRENRMGHPKRQKPSLRASDTDSRGTALRRRVC